MTNQKNPKHYSKMSNGKYTIVKSINGKCKSFGCFNTEQEVIERVQFLKENNWDLRLSKAKKIKPLKSEDKILIDTICSERNVQYKTKDGYIEAVKHFEDLFEDSLSNKLNLYFKEEELPWKKRTLKKDLIKYRSYLQSKFVVGTVRIYFVRLCTILKHLELEIHHLPPINNKNNNDFEPITYNDLLTKDIIKKAIDIANPLMKALILFCVSSGCARRETLNLTVEDYLKANEVSELSEVKDNNIPIFKIRRQKTNKYYFTYCTPQANNQIKEYLLSCKRLRKNSPVFDINLYYFNKYFAEINNALGLGQVRKYNKFRCHMLRKFNASTLYNNGMSMNDIDSLQGRGKDSTHSAYFMEDPMLLKQKYEKYVPVLTI